MAFTFRSRQGETFYLHARQESRPGGRTELVHYFAPELNPEEAVDALPAGYSVVEQGGGVRLVRSATAERHQARLETMADPRARREAKRAARRDRYEARTRPGRVDWMSLALSVGLDPDGGTVSDDKVRRALDAILGEENIRSAVGLRLGFDPGWNIAEGILRYIRSERAADLAYEAYTTASGDRAVQAVVLIKEIAHPKALTWVVEFLRDERVALLGINLLDQLVRRHEVEPDDAQVRGILSLAEAHPNELVRENAASIRRHISEREATARPPS
ncbi:MAG: hypothetical protein M3O34_06190 [Chloroflexota bacterium]|nr:hypothetical protein [Chloroflexota bacterium]